MRIPWNARSHNSLLKEINILNIHWKDWCWSWSSNTLTTWCRELTLMLGKFEGNRRRGWQRMRLLDGICDSMDMSLSKLLRDSEGQKNYNKKSNNREAWRAAIHGVAKSWTRLSHWTELNWYITVIFSIYLSDLRFSRVGLLWNIVSKLYFWSIHVIAFFCCSFCHLPYSYSTTEGSSKFSGGILWWYSHDFT